MSGVAGAGAPAEHTVVRFERSIANLEVSAAELLTTPPKGSTVPFRGTGAFFGTVTRRLPEGAPGSSRILFGVRFENGIAAQAWWDANGDDDLTNDPLPTLAGYPNEPKTRSFLAPLRWTARDGANELPVERTVRIVLQSEASPGGRPIGRIQYVHAMTGWMVVGGLRCRTVLFDGDCDGIYSRRLGDGMYVDENGDGDFTIDPMDREFKPLSVPFPLGDSLYEALEIDPGGRSVELQKLGPAPPVQPLVVGAPAPDFGYRDTAGGEGRLSGLRGAPVVLYFWASWCGACGEQAPALNALHERFRGHGVRMLGISFDTDRAAMEQFRARHRESWPTTFSGRMLWEDPVGRLYHADVAGALYLIDSAGNFVGAYGSPADLARRLESLLPDSSSLPQSH